MPIVVAILIIGAAQGSMLKNVNPGKVNVDLGDGYKVSFTLPNTVSAYDVETDSGYSDILKFHSYDVYVNAAGSKDSFLMIRLQVESQPTPYFIPKAGRNVDLKIAGIGPSVNIPQSIDGFDGYAYYGYPEGNPATNTNEANGAAFHYYPRATAPTATTEGNNVKGIYEVKADTYGSEDPRTISVFQSILKSIHVSGM